MVGARSLAPGRDGKRSVVVDGRKWNDVFASEPRGAELAHRGVEVFQVPCGTCDGCLLERSRQWAVRITHEASLYEDNCFITLTYADEHLPANGGLWPEDFQRFMKDLRQELSRKYDGAKVRYFYCGEYGETYGRPHFHAVLFGWWFPDSAPLGERNGLTVWRSELLEKVWGKGRTEIGSVTFESAAYVARYVLKKRGNDDQQRGREVMESGDDALPPRRPAYAGMSRRPGIGSRWIEQYCGEVLAADSVVIRGAECKPPRFYDVVAARFAPEKVEANKAARAVGGDKRRETQEGREAAAVIAAQRIQLFSRELK